MKTKHALVIFVFSSLFLIGCVAHKNSIQEKNISYNPQAAEINVQLGLGYLKQGDRQRAKQKLLLALQEAPKLPVVNNAMAFYLENTGSVEEAEYYYQLALKNNPRLGASNNNYGAFLCRQGKYREAEHYFLKAVADPVYIHTAEAYENAGLCAKKIPDYQKAAYYFKRAIQEDPSRSQSRVELSEVDYHLKNININFTKEAKK